MTTATTTTTAQRSGGGRGLLLFFVLSFAISWTALGALQIIATQAGLSDWQELTARAETTFTLDEIADRLPAPGWVVVVLNVVADFGPSLAALITAFALGGATAVGRLLAGLGRWRVGLRWYLFALGIPTLVMGGAIGLYAITGGEVGAPSWMGFGTLWQLLFWVVIARTLTGGGLGEELGWRGYALPRLQARMGAVAASALLGGVWAAWHLPLVLVAESAVTQLLVLVLFIFPLTFVYSWLFNGSGGSVLIVVLFHGMQNGLSAFLERSLLPGLLEADAWVLFRIALLLGVSIIAAIALGRQARLGRTTVEPDL